MHTAHYGYATQTMNSAAFIYGKKGKELILKFASSGKIPYLLKKIRDRACFTNQDLFGVLAFILRKN